MSSLPHHAFFDIFVKCLDLLNQFIILGLGRSPGIATGILQGGQLLGGGIFQSTDILAPIVVPTVENNLPPYMRNSCEVGFSTLKGRETLLGAAMLAASPNN